MAGDVLKRLAGPATVNQGAKLADLRIRQAIAAVGN